MILSGRDILSVWPKLQIALLHEAHADLKVEVRLRGQVHSGITAQLGQQTHCRIPKKDPHGAPQDMSWAPGGLLPRSAGGWEADHGSGALRHSSVITDLLEVASLSADVSSWQKQRRKTGRFAQLHTSCYSVLYSSLCAYN